MAPILLRGDLLPAHLLPSACVFSLRGCGLKRPELPNTETKIIIFGKHSLILMWVVPFGLSNRPTEEAHLKTDLLQ